MVALLNESISRQALIHLANQYESVADALMELVDNPFDYRYGRRLAVSISFDKKSDSATILDFGGQGMDGDMLCDWIQWGTGHEHLAEDIGQYHVGGKLAAIYLAADLEIACRRAGSNTVWRFRDPAWGTRTTLYSGTPEQMTPQALAREDRELAALPQTAGFTKVVLRGLKPHRYESAILRGRLGNVYRAMLLTGDVTISVDGQPVEPINIPVSSVHDPVEIPRARLGPGLFIKGRVWVTDRERLHLGRGVGLNAGVRTLYNGRLVTHGEEFGHYLAGRGSLQRLVGEIEVQGLKPNSTKTGWDLDSPEWQAISRHMHEAIQPLVSFLNQLTESHPVSREQKKRAEKVRRDIQAAFRRAAESLSPGLGGEEDTRAGRQGPTRRGLVRLVPTGRHRGAVQNRTEPPPNAVGRLLRRYSSHDIPRIDFDDLGRQARTDWRDGERVIVINTAYPLYKELGGSEAYLADCVVSHLVRHQVGGDKEQQLRIDELLWEWHHVAAG